MASTRASPSNAPIGALPTGVNIIAIQDQSSISNELSYSGADGVFERTAPCLLLEDPHWQQAATWLIANADLIVSEALVLGEGVRFELDRIYQLGRWDRTVLVLPPPDCPYKTVDNDTVVQTFPRCIWAHDFHTTPIEEHFLTKHLLERIGAIGSLPADERKRLRDSKARDA